jgi:hypothetical protein
MRWGILLVAAAVNTLRAQQQLGYKLLGSAGIDAGVQGLPGLFVIDRVLHYSATELRDRHGNVVPIEGLDIRATGNGLGLALTTKAKHAPYLSFAFGLPYATIHASSDNPRASLNGEGFADIYLQPIKLGWRERRFDVVTAYMVYAPSGHFEPGSGKGPGSGYWTHQFSLGGALFSDSTRAHRISAIASYEDNTRKRGIDIRRGNMFQVQGGAGATVLKSVTLGVASYGLWQVTPDRGTDIPPPLQGQRSRVFGVGPEIDAIIPRWKVRTELRLEREFGVTSRPKGQVIAFGVSYLAWSPLRKRQ